MPAVKLAPDLAPFYEQAAQVTARGAKRFYLATRLFPPDLAAGAHALYWFCRFTDDLADECASPCDALRQLDDWAALLEEARHRDVQDPVLTVFLDTARRHSIALESAFELIGGTRAMVEKDRFATFAELRLLCSQLGSTVVSMMCSLIGFAEQTDRDKGLTLAADLGIAVQLADLLCRLREDVARDRIYLPRDEMLRFHYGEPDLKSAVVSPAFRELMRLQTSRAREYFDRGVAVIPLLHPRGRFAIHVAVDIYDAFLRRLQAPNFDFFNHPNCTPPSYKYWFAARHMAAPIARFSARRLGLYKG